MEQDKLNNPNEVVETESLKDLSHMSFEELKKMRIYSHRIYVLGGWWSLMGLLKLTLGGAALESGNYALGLLAVLLGLWSLLSGIGAFTRPRWGKALGKSLSILYLIGIPIGTLLGILGMIAFDKGENLFGANRILNKDLNREYRGRTLTKSKRAEQST